MPLPKTTRTDVMDYAAAHIPDEAWHVQFFDFVADARLRRQLGKEYWAARCVYKMREGVQATGSLLRAQVKIQVLQYASLSCDHVRGARGSFAALGGQEC